MSISVHAAQLSASKKTHTATLNICWTPPTRQRYLLHQQLPITSLYALCVLDIKTMSQSLVHGITLLCNPRASRCVPPGDRRPHHHHSSPIAEYTTSAHPVVNLPETMSQLVHPHNINLLSLIIPIQPSLLSTLPSTIIASLSLKYS